MYLLTPYTPMCAQAPRVAVEVVRGMCSAGIKLLWPHCEDPFQGIVDQTKAMFDSLVSLGELAEKLRLQQTGETEGVPVEEQHRELLELALAVKPNRKARYRVLVALVPRIGVKALLAKAPGLALSVLEAMRDQSVGSGAGALLEMMMRADSDASWWLQPVLQTLTEGDTKLRYGLCNYALPTIARVVPGGITALLLALQQMPDTHAHTLSEVGGQVSNLWAMTAVIKVARKWGASVSSMNKYVFIHIYIYIHIYVRVSLFVPNPACPTLHFIRRNRVLHVSFDNLNPSRTVDPFHTFGVRNMHNITHTYIYIYMSYVCLLIHLYICVCVRMYT